MISKRIYKFLWAKHFFYKVFRKFLTLIYYCLYEIATRSCFFRILSLLYDLSLKVGRSKPPPVLTSGFNRLKPPRSICQKVVNTGQYESEWSLENSKGPFCGGLRYLYKFYVLSIEKRKKILPRALFMMRFPSQDGCTEFCITVHVPNTSFLASSKAE